jgi:hypothetical protein
VVIVVGTVEPHEPVLRIAAPLVALDLAPHEERQRPIRGVQHLPQLGDAARDRAVQEITCGSTDLEGGHGWAGCEGDANERGGCWVEGVTDDRR